MAPSPLSVSCLEDPPQTQSKGLGLSDVEISASGEVPTGAAAENILQTLEGMNMQGKVDAPTKELPQKTDTESECCPQITN